jgi:hypothetical protein
MDFTWDSTSKEIHQMLLETQHKWGKLNIVRDIYFITNLEGVAWK